MNKLTADKQFDEGGMQVVQRTNVRRSSRENKTKVSVKNLNLDFLRLLIENVQERSYVEGLTEYKNMLF